MAYDNTNSGLLFPNDRKEKENQPDFTGKLDVNGKEYRLSGWKKKGKQSGKPFISVSISEPQVKQQNNDPEDVFN